MFWYDRQVSKWPEKFVGCPDEPNPAVVIHRRNKKPKLLVGKAARRFFQKYAPPKLKVDFNPPQ